MKTLNKDEMKNIMGGEMPATCTAGCNMSEGGSFEYYVMCSGSSCSASDGVGCSAGSGSQLCA